MANKDKRNIQFEQPSEVLLLVNRYVMIVLAVIVLTIFVGGYWFLLKPKIASIQSVEVEDQETEEN